MHLLFYHPVLFFTIEVQLVTKKEAESCDFTLVWSKKIKNNLPLEVRIIWTCIGANHGPSALLWGILQFYKWTEKLPKYSAKMVF